MSYEFADFTLFFLNPDLKGFANVCIFPAKTYEQMLLSWGYKMPTTWSETKTPVLYIDLLCTAHGIGRSIILPEIQKLATRHGADLIALHSTSEALGFYKKVGFQRSLDGSHKTIPELKAISKEKLNKKESRLGFLLTKKTNSDLQPNKETEAETGTKSSTAVPSRTKRLLSFIRGHY